MSTPSSEDLVDGIARQIASWRAMEPSVIAPSRQSGSQLADATIALLAGARSREGQALRAFTQDAHAARPDMLSLSSTFACVMRMTEIDDIHRESAVTSSAIVIPAALGTYIDLSGQIQSQSRSASDTRVSERAVSSISPIDVMTAVTIGEAVCIRMAMALGGARLLLQGWWPSLLVAPIGAAVTTGILLRLSSEQMRQALSLAIAHTPPKIGRSTGVLPGRWILFGQAVRAGCHAAKAAQFGFQGDSTLLSSGWLKQYGGNFADPAVLLSEQLPNVRTAISAKPFAGAKQTMAALHAFTTLLSRHKGTGDGIDLHRIEHIHVAVPSAYAAMIVRESPWASRTGSLVSAPGQLTLAALQTSALSDVDRTSWKWTPAMEQFMAKISVASDADLDALYPGKWPAKVTIVEPDHTCELMVTDSPGDPDQPFDEQALKDKGSRVLGAHEGSQIVEMALRAYTNPHHLDALCTLLKERIITALR